MLDVEALNSLNASLSSVAQYAACLLVHNPDQDANAADDRLAAERMEAYVGDLPRPTPDVRRRLRRRRKRRRSDAGAVTARRTSQLSNAGAAALAAAPG